MALMWVCPVIAICFALVISALCSVMTDSVHKNQEYGVDEDEFESVYGLPGVQFEYQIEVGAGRTQCFYQHLRQESELHVAFEVRTNILQNTIKAGIRIWQLVFSSKHEVRTNIVHNKTT